MIIDVNAYLGHFAFRRLRHNTSESLLTLMDAKKIDRAVVSSASAITYRNAQSGNEDMDSEVRGHGDRLTPFAVINPTYVGWEDDLKVCHEKFGMRGLRLYPGWHNYKLSDPRCLELVRAAAARDLIVSIPIRVEDRRERSWLVDVPDLTLDDVAGLIRTCPEARFLLLNGIGYARSPLGRADIGLPANYRIEISRLTALIENEIGQLLQSLGPDRLVFGTGTPFNYPDPALLKVEVSTATPEQKEMILWRNAAAWLSREE
jgi:predicted TIM-barrel fold metal-dependent hydrolase